MLQGEHYCRMLQGENSAKLSTLTRLQFSIKTFVLSIFKWPLTTGFYCMSSAAILIGTLMVNNAEYCLIIFLKNHAHDLITDFISETN